MTLLDASTCSGIVWTLQHEDGVQAILQPVVQYQAAFRRREAKCYTGLPRDVPTNLLAIILVGERKKARTCVDDRLC